MILETFHIALVGSPNSSKASLFNALTGSRRKVANYPGVMIERNTDKCCHARRAPLFATKSMG